METFNLRMSIKIRKKLDILAKQMRRTRADVIRILIEDQEVQNGIKRKN